MDTVPGICPRTSGGSGRREAFRDRGDELTDGQPAPDDGQFLPAEWQAAQNFNRETGVSFRPLRRCVADPVSRTRAGRLPAGTGTQTR